MEKKFSATTAIVINAPAAAVWDTITNPKKIKEYLHDTNAVSDWKEGSTLKFEGEWKGKKYTDKGVIIKSKPLDELGYTWLSSASGLEDNPENYSVITYKITSEGPATKLTLTQDNIKTEEAKQQSLSNWNMVLQQLKQVAEQSADIAV